MNENTIGSGMIDISSKKPMLRIATAEGSIHLNSTSISAIINKSNEKGDVLENAKLAAIQAVKMVPQYIFMAHPISVNSVKVNFDVEKNRVICKVKVKAIEKTGVEIEAMSGVLGALMAIFDLSKRYEKDENGQYPLARLDDIKVLDKTKKELIP
ncbi:MAG: putative cyclic pyranopterin monophosphate synthase accessory protein [Candidatus Heimdallarchaeota archaeon LC_2]|nr:MAG: putative cyclic pyranopterin monophosphate synthase accessory protein [Candidatus Heimdallarchaeota archaeon LC_2]